MLLGAKPRELLDVVEVAVARIAQVLERCTCRDPTKPEVVDPEAFETAHLEALLEDLVAVVLGSTPNPQDRRNTDVGSVPRGRYLCDHADKGVPWRRGPRCIWR